jgi:cellulose synthase/poly-beta-1,6-N-acetylglucosamine synthase-like glycosyltransferase
MIATDLDVVRAKSPASTPTVAVLIPAHNEAEVITEAINSLWHQQRIPQRVVVVADNCTDATAELAVAAGAEVFGTAGNVHKKAGALNQALEQLMPDLADDDAVLIMDADTTVSAEFIDSALNVLSTDPQAGGVSSVFVGRETGTIIGELQRMEFYRYRREIRRFGNQAFVMSGTASLFRVGALRAVRAARNGQILPEGDGYYDVYSLTEDNELTFALKTLDYSCPAPGAISVTDVMETSANLYRQRHRWYLGALRNLQNYGLRMPPHLRWIYWSQQLGLAVSVLSILLMATMLTLSFVLRLGWELTPIWMVPTAILLVERLATVWAMGWKQRIIAALLIPEMVYALVLIATFASAAKDFLLGRKGAWHPT